MPKTRTNPVRFTRKLCCNKTKHCENIQHETSLYLNGGHHKLKTIEFLISTQTKRINHLIFFFFFLQMTKTRAILAVLVGVATLGDVVTLPDIDQSENESIINPPVGTVEEMAGKRRMETPEVVLQLKYESGELNRIYLAQFRKDKESWVPSVPARNNLCADLCHAGSFLIWLFILISFVLFLCSIDLFTSGQRVFDYTSFCVVIVLKVL